MQTAKAILVTLKDGTNTEWAERVAEVINGLKGVARAEVLPGDGVLGDLHIARRQIADEIREEILKLYEKLAKVY